MKDNIIIKVVRTPDEEMCFDFFIDREKLLMYIKETGRVGKRDLIVKIDALRRELLKEIN
jgi:hypothetical protein